MTELKIIEELDNILKYAKNFEHALDSVAALKEQIISSLDKGEKND